MKLLWHVRKEEHGLEITGCHLETTDMITNMNDGHTSTCYVARIHKSNICDLENTFYMNGLHYKKNFLLEITSSYP